MSDRVMNEGDAPFGHQDDEAVDAVQSEGLDEGDLIFDPTERRPLIGEKQDRALFQYHRWMQQGR
jgi:hypothetical protein